MCTNIELEYCMLDVELFVFLYVLPYAELGIYLSIHLSLSYIQVCWHYLPCVYSVT